MYFNFCYCKLPELAGCFTPFMNKFPLATSEPQRSETALSCVKFFVVDVFLFRSASGALIGEEDNTVPNTPSTKRSLANGDVTGVSAADVES